MKLLAIDTATEQCSVALYDDDGHLCVKVVPTARGHAELILPMIDAVLRESRVTLRDLEGLAFGRGPGSFTGVRIAASVIQGLAFASSLKVVGISDLAAVAQQVATFRSIANGARVLVCMDARMNEIYWAVYEVSNGLVALIGEEHVSAAHDVSVDDRSLAFGVGTGWRAYPELRTRYVQLEVDDTVLPRAEEIAKLARTEFELGRGTEASRVEPVYLRDRVTFEPPK